MCLFHICISRQMNGPTLPFRAALGRANKRGDGPSTAAWGGGHLPLFYPLFSAQASPQKEPVGLQSNSSEAELFPSQLLHGFCPHEAAHYWRATAHRKPAVRAVAQAPGVGSKWTERVSVAKFPFRHLSLAGSVTGEFRVFSHFHLPWGNAWGPLFLLSTLGKTAGTPPVWIRRFATP